MIRITKIGKASLESASRVYLRLFPVSFPRLSFVAIFSPDRVEYPRQFFAGSSLRELRLTDGASNYA